MGCEREAGICDDVGRDADAAPVAVMVAFGVRPLGVLAGGRRTGCGLRPRWLITSGFAAGRRRRGAAAAAPLGVLPAGEALILVYEGRKPQASGNV
jgi:hypothetical protein